MDVLSGGIAFNDVTIAHGANQSRKLLDTMEVNGNLVNVGGSPDAAGTQVIKLAGDFLFNSAYYFPYPHGGGKLILLMDGGKTQTMTKLGTGTLYPYVVVTNQSYVRMLGTNMTFSSPGSVLIQPGSTLDLNGWFLTATKFTNNGTLRLQGNEPVSPVPTLNAGSTVVYDGIDGTPVTVKTNWAYKALILGPGANRTYQFGAAAGVTTTVTEAFTAVGTKANPLLLRSTTEGVSWNINAKTATKTLQWVDVKDSTSQPGDAWIKTYDSVSSGNNIRWAFPPGGTVILVR